MAVYSILFDTDNDFSTIEFSGTVEIDNNLISPDALVQTLDTVPDLRFDVAAFTAGYDGSNFNSVFVFDGAGTEIIGVDDQNGGATDFVTADFDASAPSNLVLSLTDTTTLPGTFSILDFDFGTSSINATVLTGAYDIRPGIYGTSGDDSGDNLLDGTTGDDAIFGLQGEDWIVGSEGDDTMDGGEGDRDRLFYGNDPAGIDGNLATGIVTDGYGDTDTISNIERLYGTFDFDDTLTGGAGDNIWLRGRGGDDLLTGNNPDGFTDINGGDGDDTLVNLAGNVFFQPGNGDDTITGSTDPDDFDSIGYVYTARDENTPPTNGIVAIFSNATDGTITDYSGGTDTFTGIDGVEGTDNADTFTGAVGRQEFAGLAGDDTFDGGAGNDDLVTYRIAAFLDEPITGVVANLATGTGTDPFGDTDTYVNIEGLRGTDLDDELTGDDEDNRLEGRDGNDTLSGGGGDDFIDGGAGNDSLLGGDGNDVLVDGTGTDTIDGGDGEDELARDFGRDFEDFFFSVVADLQQGRMFAPEFPDNPGETLISIERLDLRGNFHMVLIGDGADNRLYSGNGDDSITGGDGRDRLRGNEGDDTLDGGAGDRDEARYDTRDGAPQTAVTVNLTTGTATDQWGDTDTLIGIEEARGSDFDDVLIGATGMQSELRGGGGNDTLTGADDGFETGLQGGDGDDSLTGGTGGAYFDPGAGADTIIGGSRDDGYYSADYLFDADEAGATAGITVIYTSERDGTITDFNGDIDTFTGLDRVGGTMLADSFTGTDGDQEFRGYGGDDIFDGGAGDRDRVDYSRPRDEFGPISGVVVDLQAGTGTDAYGDTDTYIGIERIRGTDFDDQMTAGDNGSFFLRGEGGDDLVLGGTGGSEDNYDLWGGAGHDTLVAGATGDTFFEPGAGIDSITGGSAESGFYDVSYFFEARDNDIEIGVAFAFTSERNGVAVDFAGDIDSFTGIDRVRGTLNADAFVGAEGTQLFRGYAGDDTFDGGDGNSDRVEYVDARARDGAFRGVDVDLRAGTAIDPWGDTDTLINIERIRGSNFDDVIKGDWLGWEGIVDGEDGNDTLIGGDGDDYMAGDAGDDRLEGGAGFDRAILNTDLSSLTVSISASATTVTDRRPDGEGTDTLIGIEQLEVGGGPWQLSIFDGVAGLTEAAFREFVEVYIAYFNRAPDAEGLFFYGTAFAGGTSLEASAQTFVNSAEYAATYPPALTNLAFAREVYKNVLGRDPDQPGLDFWVPLLESGAVTKGFFIVEVLKGAKAPIPDDADQAFRDQKLLDQAYLANKTDVGVYYSVTKGMSDVANATAAMQTFGEQAVSDVAGAVAAIDGFYADALDPENGAFLLELVGVVDDPFAVA